MPVTTLISNITVFCLDIQANYNFHIFFCIYSQVFQCFTLVEVQSSLPDSSGTSILIKQTEVQHPTHNLYQLLDILVSYASHNSCVNFLFIISNTFFTVTFCLYLKQVYGFDKCLNKSSGTY